MLVQHFAEGLATLPNCTRPAPRLDAPIRLVPHVTPPPSSTFLSRAREPHFLVDHQMQTISVSTALQHLLGTSAGDMLGHSWETVVDGPDELALVREKWLVAAQDHRAFSHTTRCRTTRGQIVFLFMRVDPLFHPTTGTFEGFFGAVRAQTLPLTLLHSQERSA